MKKRKIYLYALALLLILILSYLVYYCINVNSDDSMDLGENLKESNDIDWMNFKPFDFSRENVSSVTYIKDRSNLGEGTNLSWFTEDEEKIQGVLDAINNDISIVGYANDRNTIEGDSSIVIWIELADSSFHRLSVSISRLIYEETAYEIVSGKNLLMDAWKDVFRGQEPSLIIGTDKP